MAISNFRFGFEENGVHFDATCHVYDMPEHYEISYLQGGIKYSYGKAIYMPIL